MLRNDPRLAAATAAWLARLGLDPSGDMRSCGADDFSYYNAKYPSLMCFAGTGEGGGADFEHETARVKAKAIARAARRDGRIRLRHMRVSILSNASRPSAQRFWARP